MSKLVNGMLGVIRAALELPIGLWPLTIALIAIAGWSIWSLKNSNRLREKPLIFLIAISVIVFMAFPAYAIAFWADHNLNQRSTHELYSNILGTLWWAYVVFVVLTIIFSKGNRLAIGGLATLALWLNFSVFFICIMGVSGGWM
jgi:hypothetical protein